MSGLEFLPGSVEPEPAEYRIIREMWSQGHRMADIAAAIGVSSRHIDHLRAAGRLYLPKRPIGSGLKQTPRDPAPAEIRQRCLAIRRAWTPEEEQARRAGSGRCLSPTALKQTPMPFGLMASRRGIQFLPQ